MDADRKRQLKRSFKEAEEAEAQLRLGLSRTQLSNLLDVLDESLSGEGADCDHTLSRTAAWARSQGLDPEILSAAVREFGGYCDCEVAANVTPDVFGWPD